MKQRYLLIEDVDDVGRSGEIVFAKPGFARNYLLPRRKAVIATEHALGMQVRLQKEREKKAEEDRREAELFREKYMDKSLTIEVKVDPEGHMYGAVGNSDIIELFHKEGITVDKRNVGLNKSIKQQGIYHLELKLKENITCPYTLHVVGELSEGKRGK